MPLDSKSFLYPPLDGTITIPETIEFHWQHNADLPVYVFHEDGKDTNDITEITYLEFGRASHRVANLMNCKFPSITGRPVVALMALTDSLLYQAISVGLMKSGFIVRVPPCCEKCDSTDIHYNSAISHVSEKYSGSCCSSYLENILPPPSYHSYHVKGSPRRRESRA